MIAKAKSNKSLKSTIAYNEKEKADLIYANKLEGMSLDDYYMQMEDLQNVIKAMAHNSPFMPFYRRQLKMAKLWKPHSGRK